MNSSARLHPGPPPPARPRNGPFPGRVPADAACASRPHRRVPRSATPASGPHRQQRQAVPAPRRRKGATSPTSRCPARTPQCSFATWMPARLPAPGGDSNRVRVQALASSVALDRERHLAVIRRLTAIAAAAAGNHGLHDRMHAPSARRPRPPLTRLACTARTPLRAPGKVRSPCPNGFISAPPAIPAPDKPPARNRHRWLAQDARQRRAAVPAG